MSGVSNNPAGAPQFKPSSGESTGSRPAGVTADGKSVSVAPTALAPVDRKALQAMQGGEKQDTKSALRKEQAKLLAADTNYKIYRQTMRDGYKQCKEALDVSLKELANPNMTGLKLIEKLIGLAQDLHNTYINPEGERVLPVPSDVKSGLERAWHSLTDLHRSAKRAGALNGDQRQALDQLHANLTASLEVLLKFAIDEINEERILARYKEFTEPRRQDLNQILSDPRQENRLKKLKAVCDKSMNAEGLNFLMQFRSVSARPEAARIEGYRSLFDQFIRRGSLQEVNLADTLYNEVSQAFAEASAALEPGAAQVTRLDETMKEVYREVFDLFMRTPYALFRTAEDKGS